LLQTLRGVIIKHGGHIKIVLKKYRGPESKGEIAARKDVLSQPHMFLARNDFLLSVIPPECFGCLLDLWIVTAINTDDKWNLL
jgi:hypothetical protein